MNEKFDLVIIGAGCMGMAAAYYALKMNKTVCIVEKNAIGDEKKFWSQSFVARQNRVQYNQEYLTRFMRMSNDEWRSLQQELGKGKKFLYRQGSLWFGDKNVNTTEGNIKAAHETITEINSCLKEGEKKIQSLYMERIIKESPEYMRAFKSESHTQWDSWSGLYQPDGGSIDMRSSYDAFYLYIKQHGDKVAIYDNTSVVKHEQTKTQCKHRFTTSSNKVIQSKNVFICTGVYTPHFLKDVMNYPHLVDNNFKDGEPNREYVIKEYVNSYMKIEEGYENFYSHMPSFINFMKENKHQMNFTTYGFPFHNWDTMKTGYFIKLGTMASKTFHNLEEETQFFKTCSYNEISPEDPRSHAAINYAMKRMNGINAKSPLNRHYPNPTIYYQGKQTLLDYMQRKDESIVVQSGGCVINQYPLLAKTVIEMLFQPNKIKKARQEMTVIGNFLNRTRFPLKPYVNDRINKLNYCYPKNGEFKTVVIGAGCSGLYSAYRLNKSSKENIGVFDLSQRISGGLKSFQIRRTNTSMELEQMKYIPDRHNILNQLVMCLGIPNIPYRSSMRMSSMKSASYRMMDWEGKQKMDTRSMPSFRVRGHLLGMSAYQIISFSLYQILTAPENVGVITELFLMKTKEDITMEKEMMSSKGLMVPSQDIYFRNWKNFVYQQRDNPLSYHINLTLQQWNKMRPVLLFRFPYQVRERDIYEGQEKVQMSCLYPLYKFGFQNVLESQFGHQTYQFVAEQNGYFSNTSNASYLDQVMVYFLDYGDVTYRTLSGGFDNINYAMANQLMDEQRGLTSKNGGIHLSHKLVNIEKSNNKYLLTFHVKSENTPVPLDDSFKCQLLSGVKKAKLFNLIHKDLGVPLPLPDKKGYSSIQFMTERLILGMPKKSIQILYNEIDLLQEPISTYSQYYKSDRRQYESLLNYTNLKEQLPKAKKFPPLSSMQCDEMQKLKMRMMKMKGCCEGLQSQLSPTQMKRFSQLSERCFYDKVIARSNIDMKYEQDKLKRFTEDEPIMPKKLSTLTETIQSMPGMKIIMNFSKSWWDPLERINQSCGRQPTKNMSLSKTIQDIRGVSSSEMSIRHTLQVCMGQDNLLLFSFNDRITTEFWMALHNNFEKVWHPKPEIHKEMKEGRCKQLISSSPTQSIYPAKQVLVRQILKELSRIYNIQVREEWLKECVYQFMGNDQFGASSHHFYSGYYIPSIMQTMRKPWKDEAIHFVGQAYSNTSGWVEGAFQTTEMLLQKQMGLAPLVKGYYAGY